MIRLVNKHRRSSCSGFITPPPLPCVTWFRLIVGNRPTPIKPSPRGCFAVIVRFFFVPHRRQTTPNCRGFSEYWAERFAAICRPPAPWDCRKRAAMRSCARKHRADESRSPRHAERLCTRSCPLAFPCHPLRSGIRIFTLRYGARLRMCFAMSKTAFYALAFRYSALRQILAFFRQLLLRPSIADADMHHRCLPEQSIRLERELHFCWQKQL